MMTEHFNKVSMKSRRRVLRHNLPKAEAILWNHLSRKQMHGCKFRRQYSVDQYVLDFYCPEIKLAIEIDGASHGFRNAQEYNVSRQEYIESFGITFLRIPNDEVYKNIDGVCQTIYEKIESMRWV